MKKKIVIASLCLSLLGFQSAEAANSNLSVYWEADGKDKVVLTKEAYEADGQLWIPSNVVSKINRKASVKNGNQHISIPMAKLRTEYKDLNRLLMRELDLSFQTQYKNGKHYFAVTEPAEVLGVEVEKTKKGIILKEEVGKRYIKMEEDNGQPAIEGKINLVWDVMTEATRKKDKIAGLDILSPTWFDIIDRNGTLNNKAKRAYVDEAHAKGYRVWALVTNNFDRNLTKEVLADPRARENVIRQLAIYSMIYDLDGINIDFENVYDDDKDRLTAFVGEMSDMFRQMGLVSSIDVTVPAYSSYWSLCYDRKALAEKVDYMMVMTYDEHWASCPTSGSVASLQWTENNINKMLKLVPKEKLLLGIPLYTREWTETKTNGKVRTKSQTRWMKDVEKIISDKNITPTWLPEIGQDYLEYEEDGKKHRIWIENAKSIKERLSLVQKYDLAGAASWRKGFETEDVWPIYYDSLKPIPTPQETVTVEEINTETNDKDKKKEKRKKDKKNKKNKKDKKDKKDKKKDKHKKKRSDDSLTNEK